MQLFLASQSPEVKQKVKQKVLNQKKCTKKFKTVQRALPVTSSIVPCSVLSHIGLICPDDYHHRDDYDHDFDDHHHHHDDYGHDFDDSHHEDYYHDFDGHHHDHDDYDHDFDGDLDDWDNDYDDAKSRVLMRPVVTKRQFLNVLNAIFCLAFQR